MELCRVLLIEDDHHAQKSLVAFLKKSHEVQFDVIVTDRLQAGLGILRGNNIDVVVLDIGLPDNGQHLRAITLLRDISNSVGVLVLSGIITLADIKEAIKLGADECRQKPPESPEQFARQVVRAKENRRYINELLAAKDKEYIEAINRMQPLPIGVWYRRASVWGKIIAFLTALAAFIAALKSK